MDLVGRKRPAGFDEEVEMRSEKSFAPKFMAKQFGNSLAATLQEFPAQGFVDDSAALQTRVDQFFDRFAAIEENRQLSHEGQQAERLRLGTAALSDVRKWRETKLGGFKGHIESVKAAMTNRSGSPTEAEVQAMAARIAPLGVSEVRSLYAAAEPRIQAIIEAVAALTGGQVPMGSGAAVRWAELLEPTEVERARAKRLALLNPTAARKLADLENLSAAYKAVGLAAERALVEEMGRFGVHEKTEVVFRDPITGAALRRPEPLDAA